MMRDVQRRIGVGVGAGVVASVAMVVGMGGCAAQHAEPSWDEMPCVRGMDAGGSAAELAIRESALEAIRTRVETEACNLANISTPGFKRRVCVQESVCFGAAGGGGGSGGGVRIAGTRLDMMQGSPVHSAGTLDLMIQGEGFFCVENDVAGAGGLAYTRDGRMTLNSDQELVMLAGKRRISPRIMLPPEVRSVTVDASGGVWVLVAGENEMMSVGQIELTVFTAPEHLLMLDGTMLVVTPACGEVVVGTSRSAAFGEIVQGYFEGSNVDPEQVRMELLRCENERRMWGGDNATMARSE